MDVEWLFRCQGCSGPERAYTYFQLFLGARLRTMRRNTCQTDAGCPKRYTGHHSRAGNNLSAGKVIRAKSQEVILCVNIEEIKKAMKAEQDDGTAGKKASPPGWW